MIPVTLQQDDQKNWRLNCEELNLSLTITKNTGITELARLYGWGTCECGLSDGTKSCRHKTKEIMLEEAEQFLTDNIGWEADILQSSSHLI